MKYTANLKLKKPEGTDVVNIYDLNDNVDILDSELVKKVDKVSGKGLSTNDYTTVEKNKLAGIETGANKYVHPNTHPATMITTSDGKNVETRLNEIQENGGNVRSVNGKIGEVVISASDVGAVPTTRAINGKPLSNDVLLRYSDIGAAPYEVLVSQNFDSVTTPGIYIMRSVTGDKPAASSYYGLIVLGSDSSTSYRQQIAIPENSSDMYMRTRGGSGWNPWIKVNEKTKALKEVLPSVNSNYVTTEVLGVIMAAKDCSMNGVGDNAGNIIVSSSECHINQADRARMTIINSHDCLLQGWNSAMINCTKSWQTTGSSNTFINCDLVKQDTSFGGMTIFGGTNATQNESYKNIGTMIYKSGKIETAGQVISGHKFSDYAEYFESIDGRSVPSGIIVTLQGNKIKPCNSGGDMLGIISETAGIVLSAAPFTWQGTFETNEFGGMIYDKFFDEDKNEIVKLPRKNSNHIEEEDYIPREERPEWNIVGLMGQIHVRCDSTIKAGDYIRSNDFGIATKDDNPTFQRWKVMKITTPYSEEKGYGVALVFIR